MTIKGNFNYWLQNLQLMLAAQNITFGTGSGDVCYYNYLCRYRAYGFTGLWFEDYGHVFSNISYVFCGIHFIVLVYIRQRERRKAMVKLYLEKKRDNVSQAPSSPRNKINDEGTYIRQLYRKISQKISKLTSLK